jgi:hypothetical protein
MKQEDVKNVVIKNASDILKIVNVSILTMNFLLMAKNVNHVVEYFEKYKKDCDGEKCFDQRFFNAKIECGDYARPFVNCGGYAIGCTSF